PHRPHAGSVMPISVRSFQPHASAGHPGRFSAGVVCAPVGHAGTRCDGRPRCLPAVAIAFFLALVATSVPVHGEIKLALPEGGLFRPGQYLSVAITGAAGADEIRIEADGALPTRIHRPADRV